MLCEPRTLAERILREPFGHRALRETKRRLLQCLQRHQAALRLRELAAARVGGADELPLVFAQLLQLVGGRAQLLLGHAALFARARLFDLQGVDARIELRRRKRAELGRETLALGGQTLRLMLQLLDARAFDLRLFAGGARSAIEVFPALLPHLH